MVLPGPSFEVDPVTCMGRHGAVEPCVPDRSEALAIAGPIRRATASGAAEVGAPTYDPVPRTCDEERCELRIDGGYVYLDRSHLTATTSAGFGAELAQFLDDVAR